MHSADEVPRAIQGKKTGLEPASFEDLLGAWALACETRALVLTTAPGEDRDLLVDRLDAVIAVHLAEVARRTELTEAVVAGLPVRQG